MNSATRRAPSPAVPSRQVLAWSRNLPLEFRPVTLREAHAYCRLKTRLEDCSPVLLRCLANVRDEMQRKRES